MRSLRDPDPKMLGDALPHVNGLQNLSIVLWTLPVWAHVAVSGLVVYIMNHGGRPV